MTKTVSHILTNVRFVRQYLSLPMLQRALVFYGASIVIGVVNYLFNIIMARDSFLGPKGFGELGALWSLIYLDGVVVMGLMTATAFFVALLIGQNKHYQVSVLLRNINWRVGLPGVVAGIVVILISPAIGSFLHLTSFTPIVLLVPVLILSVLLGVTAGALQGMLSFGSLALVGLIGSVFRFIFCVGLVRWGLGINGVMFGSLLSVLLAWTYSRWSIRRWVNRWRSSETEQAKLVPTPSVWSLLSYAGPVCLASVGLTALYSLDVILAKHWLLPTEAGYYGGLSVLGRMIYFTTLPITMIMFPVITRRFAQGGSIRRVLFMSGGSIATIAAGFLILFVVAPAAVIRYTIGPAYLSATDGLWLLAALFAAASIATWLIYIFLAIGRTELMVLPLFAAAAQIILISIWHQSLGQIALSSVAAAIALVVGLAFFGATRGWKTIGSVKP